MWVESLLLLRTFDNVVKCLQPLQTSHRSIIGHTNTVSSASDLETTLSGGALLAAGLSDGAIGHQLGVSQRTVERRMRDLMTALNARTRFQAGVLGHR